jgi:uncharacterized membrane protein
MIETAHFHPMVVHFPIAIIIVGFLADIAGLVFKKEKAFLKMGFYLEILGMVAAIAAYSTGYFFTSPMEGEAGIMREKHSTFALYTLISIIAATFIRVLLVYFRKEETRLKYLALGVFFLAFVFVSVTGYLGGILVLEYLIGI